MESLAPHRYVVLKGRSIIIASSHNYTYSPLILHQNLSSAAHPFPPSLSRNAGRAACHRSRGLVMGGLYHEKG